MARGLNQDNFEAPPTFFLAVVEAVGRLLEIEERGVREGSDLACFGGFSEENESEVCRFKLCLESMIEN